MNLRKLTSLTAFFSFLVILLTSVILYLTPQGRIAYWADWKLIGLTKDQWGAIHINTGAIFLLSMFLHIFYNWRPILNYLQSRKSAMLSRESIAAILLVLFGFFGTVNQIPPFSSIMQLNDTIKIKAARKYGEPPYGHAELSSLTSFSNKMNQDIGSIMTALQKAGFTVDSPAQNLKDIAAANGVSPQTVFQAFPPAPAAKTESGKGISLPPSPPAGTGNMTLTELGTQYALSTEEISSALKQQGLNISLDATIKDMAASNNMSPHDLYDAIRNAAPDNK